MGLEAPIKGILYSTEQPHNDWPSHNVKVFAKGSDAVFLKGDMRTFCEDCKPQTLERSAINNHPVTDRQLRWVETGTIESPTKVSPSFFRRALSFFDK